jgi:ParB family chromosome partitioning protein
VPLGQVRPCPFQPRKDFAPESLTELADSIREQGIVQPLLVRKRDGHFELIAGERRWRAAQLVGLKDVPVIIREADDRTVLELALIENLQRENLNPMEEAQGYSQLMSLFGLTQEEASIKVGKARALVANSLRLLKLPDNVQKLIRDGRLSVGHAKAILGLFDSAVQQRAADHIIRQGLNVRQAEALILKLQSAERPTRENAPLAKAPADPHLDRLQDKLRERLGTKVLLRYSEGKGALEINFFSDAELERILGLLGVPPD